MYKITTKKALMGGAGVLLIVMVLSSYLTATDFKSMWNSETENYITIQENGKEIIHIIYGDRTTNTTPNDFKRIRIDQNKISFYDTNNKQITQLDYSMKYWTSYGEDGWRNINRKSSTIDVNYIEDEDGISISQSFDYYKYPSNTGTAGKLTTTFDIKPNKNSKIKITQKFDTNDERTYFMTWRFTELKATGFIENGHLWIDNETILWWGDEDKSLFGYSDNKYFYLPFEAQKGSFVLDPEILEFKENSITTKDIFGKLISYNPDLTQLEEVFEVKNPFVKAIPYSHFNHSEFTNVTKSNITGFRVYRLNSTTTEITNEIRYNCTDIGSFLKNNTYVTKYQKCNSTKVKENITNNKWIEITKKDTIPALSTIQLKKIFTREVRLGEQEVFVVQKADFSGDPYISKFIADKSATVKDYDKTWWDASWNKRIGFNITQTTSGNVSLIFKFNHSHMVANGGNVTGTDIRLINDSNSKLGVAKLISNNGTSIAYLSVDVKPPWYGYLYFESQGAEQPTYGATFDTLVPTYAFLDNFTGARVIDIMGNQDVVHGGTRNFTTNGSIYIAHTTYSIREPCQASTMCYGTMPNHMKANDKKYTITGWFYQSDTFSKDHLFIWSWKTANSKNIWVENDDGLGKLRLLAETGNFYAPAGWTTTNTWKHVAATYDETGNIHKMFVNSTYTGQHAYAPEKYILSILGQFQAPNAAYDSNMNFWDMRIYNTTNMSSAKIAKTYRANVSYEMGETVESEPVISSPPLVHYVNPNDYYTEFASFDTDYLTNITTNGQRLDLVENLYGYTGNEIMLNSSSQTEDSGFYTIQKMSVGSHIRFYLVNSTIDQFLGPSSVDGYFRVAFINESSDGEYLTGTAGSSQFANLSDNGALFDINITNYVPATKRIYYNVMKDGVLVTNSYVTLTMKSGSYIGLYMFQNCKYTQSTYYKPMSVTIGNLSYNSMNITNYAMQTGSHNFNISVNSTVGIDDSAVFLRLENNSYAYPWIAMSNVSNGLNWFNKSLYIDYPVGQYNVTFNVSDTDGNQNASEYAIIVISGETENPDVTITEPTSNQQVQANHSMTMNMTATDNLRIDISSAYFRVSNTTGNYTPWIGMSNLSSGGYQYFNATWNATLAVGYYNVTFNISDTQGNQNASEYSQIRVVNYVAMSLSRTFPTTLEWNMGGELKIFNFTFSLTADKPQTGTCNLLKNGTIVGTRTGVGNGDMITFNKLISITDYSKSHNFTVNCTIGPNTTMMNATIWKEKWWNQKYLFRKNYTFENTGAAKLMNYTVQFSFDSKEWIDKGYLTPNCSNLAVVRNNYATNTTYLPHWIHENDSVLEGCGSENATIYAKTYLAADDNTTIWLYFGGENMIAQNVYGTFPYVELFNKPGSVNSTRWIGFYSGATPAKPEVWFNVSYPKDWGETLIPGKQNSSWLAIRSWDSMAHLRKSVSIVMASGWLPAPPTYEYKASVTTFVFADPVANQVDETPGIVSRGGVGIVNSTNYDNFSASTWYVYGNSTPTSELSLALGVYDLSGKGGNRNITESSSIEGTSSPKRFGAARVGVIGDGSKYRMANGTGVFKNGIGVWEYGEPEVINDRNALLKRVFLIGNTVASSNGTAKNMTKSYFDNFFITRHSANVTKDSLGFEKTLNSAPKMLDRAADIEIQNVSYTVFRRGTNATYNINVTKQNIIRRAEFTIENSSWSDGPYSLSLVDNGAYMLNYTIKYNTTSLHGEYNISINITDFNNYTTRKIVYRIWGYGNPTFRKTEFLFDLKNMPIASFGVEYDYDMVCNDTYLNTTRNMFVTNFDTWDSRLLNNITGNPDPQFTRIVQDKEGRSGSMLLAYMTEDVGATIFVYDNKFTLANDTIMQLNVVSLNQSATQSELALLFFNETNAWYNYAEINSIITEDDENKTVTFLFTNITLTSLTYSKYRNSELITRKVLESILPGTPRNLAVGIYLTVTVTPSTNYVWVYIKNWTYISPVYGTDLSLGSHPYNVSCTITGNRSNIWNDTDFTLIADLLDVNYSGTSLNSSYSKITWNADGTINATNISLAGQNKTTAGMRPYSNSTYTPYKIKVKINESDGEVFWHINNASSSLGNNNTDNITDSYSFVCKESNSTIGYVCETWMWQDWYNTNASKNHARDILFDYATCYECDN